MRWGYNFRTPLIFTNKMKIQIKKGIDHEQYEYDTPEQEVCPYCKGEGYYAEAKNKPVHTCWTCLKAGRLNQ